LSRRNLAGRRETSSLHTRTATTKQQCNKKLSYRLENMASASCYCLIIILLTRIWHIFVCQIQSMHMHWTEYKITWTSVRPSVRRLWTRLWRYLWADLHI